MHFNPIRPGLSSRSPGPEGSEAQMPKIKVTINRLKLNLANAKFEFGSFSTFGDMTSQNFPLKRGTSHKIRIFTLENGFNFQKLGFYVQIRFLRLKIDPLCQFQQFSSREKFFIFKIFGTSR